MFPVAEERLHVGELFLLLSGGEAPVDGATGDVAVEGGTDFFWGGEDDVDLGLGCTLCLFVGAIWLVEDGGRCC